jgi:integrase
LVVLKNVRLSLHQQPQHQQEQGEAYKNFINSISSSITKLDYDKAFSYFMNYCKKESYDDMLAIGPKIEGVIRDYIIYLRHTRNLSPATIASYICPITHFYEMNDVTIKWKKLNKFKAKYYNITEDRPYTRQQIKILLDAATLRDKCIILVMCSAGLRRGAIPYLRIRDLQKIDKYQLYKINVYKKEQEHYITFCTPECTKYIDQYLDWRQHIGEQLKPNSPLFRTKFDTITQINRPKSVSSDGISFMIHGLLDNTRVRVPNEMHKRTELMQTHGFRKFFKTTCINAGMNPLYSEYLMGHRSGLTKSYFKPSDTELLEGNDKALGYVSAINDLTINEECRLHKKIDELTKKKNEIEIMESKHNEEIQAMRDQMSQIMSMIRQNPKLARVKPEVLASKKI